jgi:sarcosine oxidase subunit alpha
VLAARGLAAALHEHGVVSGGRIAVVGEGPEAEAFERVLAAGGPAVERIGSVEGGRIAGRARVRAVLVPGRRIRCEVVAVAGPPAPASDLARALGAEVRLDLSTGGFPVRAAPDGSTGIPGLLAAGELTGSCSAADAAEAGRRAGRAARG